MVRQEEAREAEASRMERRLLSIVEASVWLGLSQSYLYRLVEADAIPHIRFGRAIRFDVKELEDWLKEDTDGQQEK
jgi:excisionase family DNA binding protein